jgi:Arc/MetJ-type ribon-helix-helix transcriptional regulator
MTYPVTLPPRLEAFARREIAAGHFRSLDDMIRCALCLLEVVRQDRQLKAAWRYQEYLQQSGGESSAPGTSVELLRLAGST